MSESVKSWLFAHCATQATSGLEGNFDLLDMPYLAGNRVQLLRFLTFRPASAPNSSNTDVWALVGDRTHCIAARFARDQVHRFHTDYALTFTSLKGALVTLTNFRVGVARVQVQGEGGAPYRAGQYALMLDVKGWEVVSSVNEPVWFGGVKLVTSQNGVPEGEAQRFSVMLRWMKKWIRYKSLVRRAREQQKQRPHASATIDASSSSAVKLPTPAQRKTILSSSQTQNTHAPRPPQETSKVTQGGTFPLSTASPTPAQCSDSNATASAAALWTDFDLDAQIDVDDIDVAKAWGLVPSAPTAAADPTPPVAPRQTAPPQEAAPASSTLQQATASQSQTQSQTQSDLDPYESGLSDYERESRQKRKRATQSRELLTSADRTPSDPQRTEEAVESPAPASSRGKGLEYAVELPRVDPRVSALDEAAEANEAAVEQEQASETSVPASAPARASPSTAVAPAPRAAPPASSASTKSSSSSTHKQQRKRQRRQAALAALMAQVVD
ncbi:hypothetical protein EX895_002205 [Sporisorium graminicola]|uniref:Uncharacterized protein n=1 Tax=Sporisorium graminicola TaxID=280036 RepID=A0A4U7KW66_9BASI|nr:hypothetical protein EX895_002205 [Sporisorium graminicola]TKY88964.1 hypothetical protein EX895_002205 [Sporisorium graminicola]